MKKKYGIKILFSFCFIVFLIMIESPLLSMPISGYSIYLENFGDYASYMVGYEEDIDVLSELLGLCEGVGDFSMLDSAKSGLIERKNLILALLIEQYLKGQMNVLYLAERLAELKNSPCYYYERLYGLNAAYMIGYAGEIPALIEFVQKYEVEHLDQIQLGLAAGRFSRLNALLRNFIENNLDKERFIEMLTQLNNSTVYYYELRYGKRAIETIAFYGDILGLIELVETYGDNPNLFIFSSIRFSLDQAERDYLFELFGDFVCLKIDKNQLIEKLKKLIDDELSDLSEGSDSLDSDLDLSDSWSNGYSSLDD